MKPETPNQPETLSPRYDRARQSRPPRLHHPFSLFLFALLAALLFLSLLLGRYPIQPSELWHWLGAQIGFAQLDPQKKHLIDQILLSVRFPRILGAILVGASLSVAGASFQAIFSNPLVSPSLLGVLAGSSFGAVLAMVVSLPLPVIQLCSFLGGLLAVSLAVGISSWFASEPLLSLILGGIISSALFSSFLSIAKYFADPYNQLPGIVYWLMGGFSGVESSMVYWLLPLMVSGILTLFFLAPAMDILSLGEETALSLGVPPQRYRLLIISLATLISSLTVLLAGTIGWIGLIVPHAARILVGPTSKRLLPASALLGAIFLLGMDDIARTLLPSEIPLGILTELLGALVFLALLFRLRGELRQ